MTGAIKYKFTYNVNSYYGRLMRVTDLLSGSSVVIRRDYRLQANQLTTVTAGARRRLSQSQRCHLTTDSNGLLASLTTLSSVKTRFSYVRNTGLLSSRQTDSDYYMYKYGQDGRVLSVTYLTGHECLFTSRVYDGTVYVNSSCDGSTVELSQHNQSLDIHCCKTPFHSHHRQDK